MASQFESVIEELRDASDKDTNKSELLNYYTALSTDALKTAYVEELINQFEDLIELFHYRHVHDYI